MTLAMWTAEWIGRGGGRPRFVPADVAALVAEDGRDTTRPWVAEITGLSARFGYERRFLRGKEDWTRANSKGTRGVYLHWTLESGRIYQARHRTSWSSWEELFLRVDPETGTVQEDVTEEAVRRHLAETLNVGWVR